MRIERLELVGYKRLMLSNINRIVYTPESLYQLILGTNGSGKSSLLFELTPLPAQSQYYSKEGFKSITLSHKGHQYVLTSSFKSGNKHSFNKDGEELNPGGTMSVQRELVRNEFNITPDLHELLIGQNRFTQMSPLQRRDWITSLSDVDYSYALGVFNKVRTLARDRIGTLKHLRERLANETNALKTLVIDSDAVEQENRLHHELHVMAQERVPNIPGVAQVEHRVRNVLDNLETCSKDVLRHFKVLRETGWVWQQDDALDIAMARLRDRIAGHTAVIDRATQEVESLRDIAQRYGQGEAVIPEDLDMRYQHTQYKLEQQRQLSSVFQPITDPRGAMQDINAILADVTILFQSLPDNSDRRLSKDTEAQAKADYDKHRRDLDIQTSELNRVRTRLRDMETAKDQTCPQCKYVWREGYSEAEYANLGEWVSRLVEDINIIEGHVAERRRFLDEIDVYSGQCRQFRGYVQSYPRLSSLWTYILNNQLLTDKPAEQTQIFSAFKGAVEVALKVLESEEELRGLELLKAQRDFIATHDNPKNRMDALEEEIARALEKRRHDRAELQKLEGIDKDREAVEDLQAELNRLRLELEQMQATWIDALRNELLDVSSRKHQQALGHLQVQLTAKRNLEQIVEDIARSLEEVKLDSEALNALAKSLSPTDGLIAEQLTGFIGCFTSQLNSVISSIWTYDLEVLPCGLDSGELNYKFPLQVNGADNTVVDIGKGSKAQQEIVNFAFILTVMLYRGLQDYPLFLDELGEGFDEQHRENAMTFIKHLLDVGQYSQIFMISHYMSSWSVFEGAQHLVLDSTNIAVPEHINEHVTLG